MDLKEAASILNISESTARRWIKSGKLRAELIDGPYGPQYDISEEAIERAKNIQNVPIIVHNDNPIITQEDITRAIQRSINEGMAKPMHRLEQGILQEVRELKGELSSLKGELVETREELITVKEKDRARQEERDRQLMKAIRDIQERQKRPWYKKIFRSDD
ncbi:MAG: helix-turn-helix domain-containing protein [Clostridia bacterium]|nr:helix-turn-helix domain-containing protein [Clostridia bacterium]